MAFPNPCSYCNELYKTKSCLLPYQIVQWVRVNQYIIESANLLAKVHGDFGSQNLSLAKSKAIEFETSAMFVYDDSVRSEADVYYSQHPSVTNTRQQSVESIPIQEKVPNEQANAIVEAPQAITVKEPDVKSLEDDNDQVIYVKKVQEAFDKFASITNESNDSPKLQKAKSPASTTIVRGPATTTSEDEIRELLFDEEMIQHVARDICGSALVAKSTSSKYKDRVTVDKFTEVMRAELEKMNLHGDNYIPKQQDTITHPTGLVKFLCSYHSHDEVQDWEDMIPNKIHKLCVLNEPVILISDPTTTPVDDVLRSYIKRVYPAIRKDQITFESFKRHLNSQSEIFQVQDLSTWIHNVVMKESDTRPKPRAVRQSVPPAVKTPSTPRTTVHVCPAIDETDVDVLEAYGRVAVNRQIKGTGVLLRDFGTSTTLEDRVFALTKELIAHNPRYHHQGFKVTAGILENVLKYTSLSATKTDKSTLLVMLSLIIADLAARR